MPVGIDIPSALIWIALAHIELLIGGVAYALLLDYEWVFEKYYPDNTWLTVVVGEFLIGPFVMLLFQLQLPLIPATCFYISLHIVAGLPIIHWQRQRAKVRADRGKALDRRP